jgi:hypothetical protein
MADEMTEDTGEKKGFLAWIKNRFSQEEADEEEEPTYKRKLLDGRIEKYLDQNFSSYIKEYGILDGLDLESYEIRYERLTGRVSSIKEYMIEADADITRMEKDLSEVSKASRKKK